jgi:hypothetical protein
MTDLRRGTRPRSLSVGRRGDSRQSNGLGDRKNRHNQFDLSAAVGRGDVLGFMTFESSSMRASSTKGRRGIHANAVFEPHMSVVGKVHIRLRAVRGVTEKRRETNCRRRLSCSIKLGNRGQQGREPPDILPKVRAMKPPRSVHQRRGTTSRAIIPAAVKPPSTNKVWPVM